MITGDTEMKFSEAMDIVGQYLKQNGLIVVQEDLHKADQLKERYKRKSSLTFKQIADGNIWGDIGKQAVKVRVEKYLKNGMIAPYEIDRSKQPFTVRRQAFERIGKQEGTL